MNLSEVEQRLKLARELLDYRLKRADDLVKLSDALGLQLSQAAGAPESDAIRHELHETDQARLRNAGKLSESFALVEAYENLFRGLKFLF